MCTPTFGDLIINPAFADPDQFIAYDHGKPRSGKVISLRGGTHGESPSRVLFVSFGEVTRCSMVQKARGTQGGNEFQSINWNTIAPFSLRTLGFMGMASNVLIHYKSYQSSFGAATIGVSEKGKCYTLLFFVLLIVDLSYQVLWQELVLQLEQRSFRVRSRRFQWHPPPQAKMKMVVIVQLSPGTTSSSLRRNQ